MKKRDNQNVRTSSKEVFPEYLPKLRTEKERVLEALNTLKEATRKQLEVFTELPCNHITKAVKVLLENELIHELPDKRKCPITGRKVFVLRPGKQPDQMQLFVTKCYSNKSDYDL